MSVLYRDVIGKNEFSALIIDTDLRELHKVEVLSLFGVLGFSGVLRYTA